MKKRNRSIIFCIILCVSLLTGCGGKYAGLTEGDAVSGSAVSGKAVSGDAIQEKTVSGPAVKDGKDGMSSKKAKQDMSSHRFCTDTNLYYISYNAKKIMQARTDGTHRECIKEYSTEEIEEYPVDRVKIVYADENWLYYEVTFDDWWQEIAYRAPIEKDAKGYDVVKISKEEELVKTGRLIDSLYADSDYYFYEDLDTEKVVKYDLKRKVKDSEMSADYSEYREIFRIRDHYVMVTINGEIYIQNLDLAQWKKVSEQYGKNYVTNNAEAVFYPQRVTEEKNGWSTYIKRHDGEHEKDFVTWEQLDHAMKEAAGVDELDAYNLDRMFWQEERLYIQMWTGWMKDGTYHMECMVFSQGENEDGSGSGLRYERELAERMKSHVKERTGKWIEFDYPEETAYVEHMVVNDAKCIAMVEGKAYLSLYDYEEDTGRMACYDLTTGKFEWINKQDAAFYKLGYDSGDLYGFRGVFNKYGDNQFVDDWNLWPSEDKNIDGYFKEDKKR